MKIEYPRKVLEKLAFLFIFIILVLGVYFSRMDLSYYEEGWIRENGLIKWLTVLALFVGMLMNLYRASILKPFRSRRFVLSLYVFAFLFFFGFMEEISWGQKIVGSFANFQFLEFFGEYGFQLGGVKVNKLIFDIVLGASVVFYLFILPIFYRRMIKVKTFVDSIALPLPRIYHIIAYLVLIGLCAAVSSGKRSVMLEFGGSWIFLLIFFEPYNRKVFSRRLTQH